MTAPATPPATEDAAVAEIVAILATAGLGVLAADTITSLVAALVKLGVPRAAARTTVTVVFRDDGQPAQDVAAMSRVPTVTQAGPQAPNTRRRRTTTGGPVASRQAMLELARRAQFLIAAARRTTDAQRRARSRNEPVGPALVGAARRERTNWGRHVAAANRRRAAAQALDDQVAEHGPVLEWRSRRDNRVTTECRVADGHVFTVTEGTRIGLPGIGAPRGPHHGCRCRAVKPTRRNQTTVDQALAAAGITGTEH